MDPAVTRRSAANEYRSLATTHNPLAICFREPVIYIRTARHVIPTALHTLSLGDTR